MESSNCLIKTLAVIITVAAAAAVTFVACGKLFNKKYITVSE